MKNKLIFVFTLFIVNCCLAQVKKFKVEPAYVAAKLLEMVDSKEYPGVCIYYGYQPDSTATEGTHIYSDGKGSSAYWLDSQVEESDSIHELKFRTNQSIRTIEEALTQCGYQKTSKPKVDIPSINGIRYEKRNRFSNRSKVIIIQPGSPNTLHLIRKK
ncbi:MAG: hypothetical protein K2H63_10265 [Paramuribaculum sp.]|nr:hypothetical protein [Paramuribaculum sp.]